MSLSTPSLSTTLASQTPSSSSSYTPPAIHGFPAFYTLQPNLTTRSAQLAEWTDYILSYCAHHRTYRLTSSHGLFTNTTIDRRLAANDARVVFAHMIAAGRAEPVDPTAAKKVASAAAAAAATTTEIAGRAAVQAAALAVALDEVWVFWKTPEEWAAELQGYVDASGQRNTVLTLWELVEGDVTRDEVFHGLPAEMARRAVGLLVRRGKASLFGEGEGVGVKFY